MMYVLDLAQPGIGPNIPSRKYKKGLCTGSKSSWRRGLAKSRDMEVLRLGYGEQGVAYGVALGSVRVSRLDRCRWGVFSRRRPINRSVLEDACIVLRRTGGRSVFMTEKLFD